MLSQAAVVALIALTYGYFADHFYTVWRDGRIPQGRSRCDECDHPLSWEMTPVLGYLVTRGRCWRGGCSFVIPRAYPLVETVGLVVGAFAAVALLRDYSFTALIVILLGTWVLGTAAALALHRVVPPRTPRSP